MQKIAILADIHGNILALEAVIKDLQRRGVDTVVTLGDQISGPLWPQETAQFLMKQDWFQIAGNHDRQLVNKDPASFGLTDQYTDSIINTAERNWLRTLPATMTIEDEILLFHGTPTSDRDYFLDSIRHGDVQLANSNEIQSRIGGNHHKVLLCGHSHIARCVTLSDQTLIINPGSVGLPAYTDDQPEKHKVETGSPSARYAILEQSSDSWAVELISIPYNHDKAADKAHENNRFEWETWLRTGYSA